MFCGHMMKRLLTSSSVPASGPVIGFGSIQTSAPAAAAAAVVPSWPRVTVQVLAATAVTVMVSPLWPSTQTEMLNGVGGGLPPATVIVVCAALMAAANVVLSLE